VLCLRHNLQTTNQAMQCSVCILVTHVLNSVQPAACAVALLSLAGALFVKLDLSRPSSLAHANPHSDHYHESPACSQVWWTPALHMHATPITILHTCTYAQLQSDFISCQLSGYVSYSMALHMDMQHTVGHGIDQPLVCDMQTSRHYAPTVGLSICIVCKLLCLASLAGCLHRKQLLRPLLSRIS
jgi:hypothetical protein